jgi:lyso-ornithine lipid O-acyltransferase
MNVAVAVRLAPIAAWLFRVPARASSSPLVTSRRQHEAARTMCKLHGIDLRVEGDRPRGPALLVANHIGYFDPIVIGALAKCVSVAKEELRSWPVVGWRLRELGVLFVDRADPWSGALALRAMLRAFHLGMSVLIFPEGTTTDGTAVLPFRRGAFGAARIAGVPIVPVRVDYDDPRIAWTGNATFLPHYLAMLSRGQVRARVAFGRAIPAHVDRSPRELANAARDAIEEMPRERANAAGDPIEEMPRA